jgi:hypothetical protein
MSPSILPTRNLPTRNAWHNSPAISPKPQSFDVPSSAFYKQKPLEVPTVDAKRIVLAIVSLSRVNLTYLLAETLSTPSLHTIPSAERNYLHREESIIPPVGNFQEVRAENSYTDEELFAAMPLDYEVSIPPLSSRTMKARVVSVQRGTPSQIQPEEL